MSDADISDSERRVMAEGLFEKKENRNEIKDAIKLEEARRAAAVKNLYRLGAYACRGTKPAHPNAKNEHQWRAVDIK
jgi:hypothetical protein